MLPAQLPGSKYDRKKGRFFGFFCRRPSGGVGGPLEPLPGSSCAIDSAINRRFVGA